MSEVSGLKLNTMRKLIMAIIFLNIACHAPKDTNDCHYKIKFKNNTDRVLFIDSSSDTILESYMDPRPYYVNTVVLPRAGNNNIELGRIPFIRNGRPMCIEDLYKDDEKLYVFVYDSIVLGNKDWDEVKKNYLLTKRYDVTVEELRKTNFTIEYNGE
jgi:hypothetical protein